MEGEWKTEHTHRSSGKHYGRAGLLVFVICVGSCGFLLLSPFVPNYFGEWLDNQYLRDAQRRIELVRKGPIRLRFVDGAGTPLPGIKVTYNLTQHAFLFGAMFFHYGQFSQSGYNETYAAMWSQVFNYALLPFYWTSWESPAYYPEEGRINATIEYCHARNVTMKGHCLVWNHAAGIPPWLDPLAEHSDAEISAACQDRIYTLLRKYAYNVTYWDVTNEVVHRGMLGTLDPEAFTHQCFAWARDAVPGGHYIFNDYSILGHDYGDGDVARFCARLNTLGTPYDAIGMQGHNLDSDWIPTYDAWCTLEGFAGLGKYIHLTEIMVPSRPVPITNSWKKGLWSPENQAEYIRRLYTVAFSHPSVESIAWWGFEDRSNPTRNEGYGLVNADLTPKPAYTMLDTLINHEWHTEGVGVLTDASGGVEFSGFYGTYTVAAGGRTFTITAQRGQVNEFVISV